MMLADINPSRKIKNQKNNFSVHMINFYLLFSLAHGAEDNEFNIFVFFPSCVVCVSITFVRQISQSHLLIVQFKKNNILVC